LSTSYLRAGTFYSTTFARGNAGEEVVSKFIPFAGGNLGRTVAKDTIRNTASINFDHAKPAFRKKIFEASSLKINITQVIASSDDGNVPLNTIDMNYKTRL
jgi:hypothetical protein